MKKRSILLIIGLMSFALLGVLSMQLYFLRQSYQMQSQLFDHSVNEALSNVVSKVSKHDADNFLNAKAQGGHKYRTPWNTNDSKINPGRETTANISITKPGSKRKLTRFMAR
jgi:two-component system phosphate regulon sensor histidine kinase PhoR